MKKYMIISMVACLATFILAQPASAESRSDVRTLTNEIVDDLTAISDASSSFDVDELSSACSDLQDHTSEGLGYTKPSDVPKAAWRHIRKAWSLMYRSADLCIQGADNLDPDALSESIDLMDQAGAESKLAVKWMR